MDTVSIPGSLLCAAPTLKTKVNPWVFTLNSELEFTLNSELDSALDHMEEGGSTPIFPSG